MIFARLSQDTEERSQSWEWVISLITFVRHQNTYHPCNHNYSLGQQIRERSSLIGWGAHLTHINPSLSFFPWIVCWYNNFEESCSTLRTILSIHGLQRILRRILTHISQGLPIMEMSKVLLSGAKKPCVKPKKSAIRVQVETKRVFDQCLNSTSIFGIWYVNGWMKNKTCYFDLQWDIRWNDKRIWVDAVDVNLS